MEKIQRSVLFWISGALVLCASCGDRSEEQTWPLAADIVAHHISHNLTVDGRLLARIDADSMYYGRGSYRALLWGPSIDLTPGFPDNPPHFAGGQLLIDYALREFAVRGNASIELPSTHHRIEGDEIRFGYRGGWLSSDSVVLKWADDPPDAPPVLILGGFRHSGTMLRPRLASGSR